jgi:hypothetical protein
MPNAVSTGLPRRGQCSLRQPVRPATGLGMSLLGKVDWGAFITGSRRPTLRLWWSQGTDLRRETVLSSTSADLGRVPGVAAFRRPRLVAVLAVLSQP